MLWCSCDPQRAHIADSLLTVNSECFLTFKEPFPPCNAAKILLQEVDCVNDITPALDFSGEICKYQTNLCLRLLLLSYIQITIMQQWIWKEDGRYIKW